MLSSVFVQPMLNAPIWGISYVFGLLMYWNCCGCCCGLSSWFRVYVCSITDMGCWFVVGLFGFVLLSMNPGPPEMLGATGVPSLGRG